MSQNNMGSHLVGPLADEQGAGNHLPGVVGHQLHRGGAVNFPGNGGGQQVPLLQQGDVVVQGVYHGVHLT